MNGITIAMAIIDFIPVVLFFMAALILLNDLYQNISRASYILLSAGSFMVFAGGLLKATWKVLYALKICDYTILDTSFFPFQGIGFLLVFLSLIGYSRKIKGRMLSVVPVFISNMPFIIMQIIGCAGTQIILFIKSVHMKKKSAAGMYVISFLFMLTMGYLSAKFDDSSSMHWLAQWTNIISQGAFLTGTVILHQTGIY